MTNTQEIKKEEKLETKDVVEIAKENPSEATAGVHEKEKKNSLSFKKIQSNLRGDIAHLGVDDIWVASIVLVGIVLIGFFLYGGVLLWRVYSFQENVVLDPNSVKDKIFHSEQVLEVLNYYEGREAIFEHLKVLEPDIPTLR